jgi:hypothetical protein
MLKVPASVYSRKVNVVLDPDQVPMGVPESDTVPLGSMVKRTDPTVQSQMPPAFDSVVDTTVV